MAKKKKQPKSLTNEQAYEAYLADQDKKKQEQANGQVRFREASNASRIQYTNPTYKGNSENGNYKWETNTLKEFKMPKGMGKSYNDKFNYMTQQMGMSPGQAQDFRTFMDYQEDKDKSKYEVKRQEFKKDKDGNLIEENTDTPEEAWKLDRKTYTDGSGLHTKQDIIDGILSGMTSKAVQSFNNAQERQAKEKEAKQKEAEKKALQKTIADTNAAVAPNRTASAANMPHNRQDKVERSDFADKFVGFFTGKNDIYGDPIEKSQAQVKKHLGENTSASTIGKVLPGQKVDEVDRFLANIDPLGLNEEIAKKRGDERSLNELYNERKIGEGGGTDMIAKGLGYLPTAGGAYKWINGAKGLAELGGRGLIERLGVEGIKGAAIGTGLSGAEVGIKEGLNPENQDWKDNAKYIGANAIMGAGADIGLAGLGLGGANLLGRMAKVDGELPTFSGKVSDNVLDSLAPNQSNTLKNSNSFYENIINPPEKRLRDFTSNEIPEVSVPSILDELPTPRSVKLEDIIKGEINPESIANAYNQKQWYHGTGSNTLTSDSLDPLAGSHESLFGQGIYMTDSPEIANGYAKARSKKAGNPTIYDAKVNMNRVLDLEKPIPEDAKLAIDKFTKPLDYHYNRETGEEGYFSKIANEMADNGATTEEIIQRLKSEIRDFSHEAGISTNEFVENFQDLAINLKAHGYDGLTHTGGGRTGHDPHRVLIALDPNDLYARTGRANQITELNPNEPANLLNKKKADKWNNVTGNPKADALDEALSFLGGNKKSNSENVNNSQSVDKAIDNLNSSTEPAKKLSMDEFNALVRGEQPVPPKEEAKGSLVPLSLQRFNSGDKEFKLFNTDGTPVSEKVITKKSDQWYENYISSTHSAKVAERKLLESQIESAKREGKTKTVEKLKAQLKEVNRSGSDFEKAILNERASGVAAKNFLTRHLKELDSIVKDDKEMADALTYQVAKDLQWRKANGMDEYHINDEVSWGDIEDIARRGDGNETFQKFTEAMKNLTQEWRDTMLDAGLISKESHEALSKNPYYMPLQRDIKETMDNIDKSIGGRSVSNKRASGPAIVHGMKQGDLDSFYKNPIETLINNTFAVYKNAYKEETGRQALRLAELDSDGMFVKEISKKQFEEGGGIKVANGGNARYVRLQDDLMRVIKENDEPVDMDMLGKLTNMFAGLKTRSFEYQMTAAPRDLATGYLNSQITNPFRYLKEAFKSIKSKNSSVKEVGGYFDKAYNNHTGGVDSKKLMDEFKRQYGEKVHTFDPKSKESWKHVTNVIGKYLDMPFKPAKWLGKVTDDLPRDIEAKETERLFMQKHGQKIENIKNYLNKVDERLAQAEGVTDPFDPRLQGIDKLQKQKGQLEDMLTQYQRDLNREKLYRSRDVINYSRHGRGGVAKKIKQWVIFANTTTQSKDKVVRSFMERPGATAFKMALAMSPFITAQKIMHENMSDSDKEIYDKLPNYVKQANYVYIDNGTLTTVPKIQELALLSDPIEAMLQGEPLNDSARFLAKEGIPYQLGNVAQGLIPDEEGNTLFNRDPMTKNMMGSVAPSTVLTPFADVMFNDKTGFNRKPISYSDKKANDWTLGVFKDLVGDNPNADALQYLLEQYGGDYGKYSTRAADYTADMGNQDKLDELIRYLNPFQDRIYTSDSHIFKPIPQETRK